MNGPCDAISAKNDSIVVVAVGGGANDVSVHSEKVLVVCW